MRRVAVTSSLLLLLLAAPGTASAVTVGPREPTPLTAKTQLVAEADGTLHGFGSTVQDRDASLIQYAERRAGVWKKATSPYRGLVYDVAVDSTGTYVLYRQHSTDPESVEFPLMVAKRTATGSFLAPRLLDQGPINGGSLVARDGKWWSVWSRRPGNTGGQLWQAGTLGSVGLAPRQVSGVSAVDLQPSLDLWGSGAETQAVLVWARATDMPPAGTSQLFLAAADSSGTWRSRRLTSSGSNNGAPALALSGGISVAWIRDGETWFATNRSGAFRSTRLRTASEGLPFLDSSGGHDYVATSLTVFAQTSGRWTSAPAGGTVDSLTAYAGKATILVEGPGYPTRLLSP